MLNIALATFIVTAPSTIDRVVVLSDRAEVIRQGQTDCRQGTADIVFEPLPYGLDVRTLRADAGRSTRVLGLRHETVELTTAANAEAARLEKEQVNLQDEQRALDHRQQALDDRQARLERLVMLYRTATTEQLQKAKPNRTGIERDLKRFRAERTAIASERRKINKDRKTLARRASRLQRRLAQQSGRAKAFIRATVSTACSGQSARSSLAYVVPRARWRPEYDVDVRPRADGTAEVRLTTSALIEQSTGEDWTDAEIWLSTARPRLGTDAPYPQRPVITGSEREEEKVLVEGYVGREVLGEGRVTKPSQPTGVQLDDGGTTITLKLPARSTIRADGRSHWFPVDESRTTAQQKWVAIPRVKRGVFRVAQFQNPARYPLLAGRINSFVNGDFVGRSPLAFTGASERMEVSLGQAPGLALDRAQRVDKEAVEGFLSSTKNVTRAYRIVVHNRTDQPRSIEVRAQVPVSENEDIEVRMIKAGTTDGYTIDRDRGLVRWAVNTAPHRDSTVDFAFEIEFPDDWKVE